MDGVVTCCCWRRPGRIRRTARSYTFKLRKGVTFSDGAPFDSAAVKFSFDRAKAEGSTNKAKKAVFDNISSVTAYDPLTVILTLNNADATMPFRLGENTAVILHLNTWPPAPRRSRSAPGRTGSTAGPSGSAVLLVKSPTLPATRPRSSSRR